MRGAVAILRLVLLLALCLPAAARAQGAATLLADRIEVTEDSRLVAEGEVEVAYDGTTLSATRITYDRTGDRLEIDGPILIRAPDGTILTAEAATLDPQLRNGLLRSARLVLERRLQLAAGRIDRIDGRYSQLTQAVATSCRVCGTAPPLWEIRAARVVHDEEAQQLYFENATFRVRGVPIFWLPRMRLPDPTLTRATGFLRPEIRTNDRLGFGVKVPYFIRLGDYRDLTLTPYLSPRTRTLELRYRQAFRRGAIAVNAAASDDRLRDDLRSYLSVEGAFDLPRDFKLDFDAETVSDRTYLLDYGYGDADRLDSAISLRRVRDNDLFRSGVIYYQSLRENEEDDSLPPVVAGLSYERVLEPAVAGGTVTLAGGIESFWRTTDTPGDAGRDVARIGFGANWRRDWLFGPGLLAEATGAIDLDYFAVSQDPAFDDAVFRATPTAGLLLRWPLIRSGAYGVTDVLEPAVALAWSDSTGGALPNDDSTLVEFDEGNLLSFDRFPGEDRRETGARAAFGLTWTRTEPGGVAASFTLGRVLRDEGALAFADASGLRGRASDWLVAGSLDLPRGFSLNARTLFDGDFDFAKTAARLNWANPRLTVAAAYVWLPADDVEGRAEAVSEWTVDGSYQISDRWGISTEARYDVAADRPARAGLGLAWRNECVTVDLSVARRYTSSGSVEPSTDFGLTVGISGFSAGRAGGEVSGRCAQ